MLRLSVADFYGTLTHEDSTEWFTFKTIVVHNKKPRGGNDRTMDAEPTNLDRYSNLETMCNEMRGSRVATKSSHYGKQLAITTTVVVAKCNYLLYNVVYVVRLL